MVKKVQKGCRWATHKHKCLENGNLVSNFENSSKKVVTLNWKPFGEILGRNSTKCANRLNMKFLFEIILTIQNGIVLGEWMDLEFSWRNIVNSCVTKLFHYKTFTLKIDPIFKTSPSWFKTELSWKMDRSWDELVNGRVNLVMLELVICQQESSKSIHLIAKRLFWMKMALSLQEGFFLKPIHSTKSCILTKSLFINLYVSECSHDIPLLLQKISHRIMQIQDT